MVAVVLSSVIDNDATGCCTGSDGVNCDDMMMDWMVLAVLVSSGVARFDLCVWVL